MKRFAGAALLCLALSGQTFEVASVKPNDSGTGHSDVDVDGNLLRMKNVTLKACIVWAFGLTDAQVSGPSWLDSERFDIVAKTESGALSLRCSRPFSWSDSSWPRIAKRRSRRSTNWW